MPLCITGGTGYVGRRLIERLVARREDIRLLVRPTSNAAELASLPVYIVQGDILDRASLRQAMDGCAQVFHLAALVRLWAKDAVLFYDVNVQGLRNVLDTALELGVERVVHTSSARAIGPTNGRIADETYQCDIRYQSSAYDRSKREAEKLIANYIERGLSVVIVNPTNVFGPPAFGGRVFRILERLSMGQIIPTAGDGRAVENYVYIDDVVEGHLLSLEKGRIGERYILGGENVPFNELIIMAAEVVGQTPNQIHLPLTLLDLLAITQEMVFPLLKREPSVVRPWVDVFRHDWAYSSAKAEDELGYKAQSVRAGLEMTWAWMQRQGKARLKSI
jgi:nucleoside-diphosphate-sugar epimerase